MSDPPVHTVHLVAKTHLDLGFTGLAEEVVEQYLTDFFPRAIAVAAELDRTDAPAPSRRESGPSGSASSDRPKLVWTTGSWILREALERNPDPRAARAVEQAVRSGVLAWHGLPVTTHTELLDADVFRHGLSIAAHLDERFGRRTIAAKMTDVPGHTRAIVPLLAAAGIRFLHLGVNPAWPVPDVPPVFRWRSPEGAEIIVAYSAGGYGEDTHVPDSGLVLSFLHSGDNLGPPTAQEVRAAHERLAARHPGARILASTLGDYAEDLLASQTVAALPVVTAEIGDPWIFGVASDPQKTARHRRLLDRIRPLRDDLGSDALAPVDELLLLTAEHTWGLDQKIVYPHEPAWDDATLARLRTEDTTRRFEASWSEQRAYVDRAEERLAAITAPFPAERRPDRVDLSYSSDPSGPSQPSGPSASTDQRWQIRLDPDTAAIVEMVDREDGRRWADADHPLGVLRHQRFSAAEYDRFLTTLTPTEEDRWWAIRDNSKPGIDAAGAVADSPTARLLDTATVRIADEGRVGLRVRLGFDAGRPGAPAGIEGIWTWSPDSDDPALRFDLSWADKAPTRLPEAIWLSWNALVDDPVRWRIDKMGSWISPLEVVRHGGRSLHAMGAGGLRHEGGGRTLRLRSLDAPLVAPGTPNLLDADPPVPDLDDGWHVLLQNNCWGTNFPMWNEGPARFRFELDQSRPSARRT